MEHAQSPGLADCPGKAWCTCQPLLAKSFLSASKSVFPCVKVRTFSLVECIHGRINPNLHLLSRNPDLRAQESVTTAGDHKIIRDIREGREGRLKEQEAGGEKTV